MSADSPDSRHELEVEDRDEGRRLDAWLAGHFPDLSRSVLKRYVQDGRVALDGTRPKPSTLIRAGERIVVMVPPPAPPFPVPQDLPLEVLHEDDSILVIVKASDMVVHPSPGVAEGGTLVNALLAYTDELSQESGSNRPGIVHRLDRETSGVMVVARTDAAHRHLAAQFKERQVHKEYLAFAHGIPKELEGHVDLPIARSLTQRKKMAIRHDEDGKSSQTRWQVVRRLGDKAWFHCFPRTGRTHQIRLHLKAIGHPILCDAMYGREKKLTRSALVGAKPNAAEEPLLRRHALHAFRLCITHPMSGESLTFEAPMPPDMAVIWALSEEYPPTT